MGSSAISLGLGLGGGKAATSSGSPGGGGAFTNQYSVSFDGSDDYLDIDGVSSTIAASDDFTISAWAKNDGGYGYIFRCSEAVDSTSFKETIGLGIFSNKAYGLLQNGGSFIEYADSSGTTVNDNAWHHFALTISESSGTSTLKLYVDGSLAGSSSLAITIPNTISVASVGRRPYNSSGTGDLYFGGLIDEVAVFNTALSASQVTNIYKGEANGGSGGTNGVPGDLNTFNPVGWWRMGDKDNGTGTIVTDQGTEGNNGTLTNGAAFSTTVPS